MAKRSVIGAPLWLTVTAWTVLPLGGAAIGLLVKVVGVWAARATNSSGAAR